LLVANYFNDYNNYTTNQIISQPKTSFDRGWVGVGGGEESFFFGKTAVVANWQINLLFCFRA